MIKLVDLLKETTSHKYEYGCVMLYFDFDVYKIHNIIDDSDIFEDSNDDFYGLENEPHCTLLYGLHKEVTLDEIKNIISNFKFNNCRIYNASYFSQNDNYDVLKFDVEGNNLYKANEALKTLPYTSNFPDYHPHLTIAYLNKYKNKDYIKLLKNKEFELKPKYIVYSQPDGNKSKIKIK